MAFSEVLRREVEQYCSNHLPQEVWYEEEFTFIQDEAFRTRIVKEFKAIRFAYKLYEGIGAKDENLLFKCEIRSLHMRRSMKL